jgi:hypothetical protein
VRLRLWKQLAAGLAVGVVPLLLLPAQNAAITGSWRESPLALYTRQYMPYDRVGFGLDSTPPQFSQPSEAQPTIDRFRELRREHVPAALPGILRNRLAIAAASSFGGWRKFLIIPAVIGLWFLGASGWFALVTGLLLYVGYLSYAHEVQWSIYYLETTPVPALAIALGLHQLLAAAVGNRARSGVVDTIAALVILLLAAPELSQSQRHREASQRPYREFDRQVAAQGDKRTLIFVRYAPGDPEVLSLSRNVPDPDRAVYLAVHDLGKAENTRVAAHFPDRAPYLWDGAAHRLVPIDR